MRLEFTKAEQDLIDEASGLMTAEAFVYKAALHMAREFIAESTPEDRRQGVPHFGQPVKLDAKGRKRAKQILDRRNAS